MNLFSPDASPPGHPYWWDGVGEQPDLSSAPPDRTDVLIIGGGYTGLSAAITCADAGARVTVVDAWRPGAGASTRNGGMFGAHPRLPFETVQKRFGEDAARGIYAEARSAYDFTHQLIEREAIDCDFAITGRIQMAWTKAQFEAQKKLVAAITARADFNMEIIDRDALQRDINTARYFGAIRFPDHAGLQPRKFHDGLLTAALKRGVTIVRDCPVETLKRTPTGFEAVTSNGTVRCERAILATNGYTRGRFGWFRRRVFPLPSYLIATQPLSPETIRQLAPAGRMMVETRARHSYFRVSPDGSRIIFGGRASMTQIDPQRAAKRLHQTMCGIWPDMHDIKLTHSWGGNTGYSFTHMPHVGVRDGLHYALGYSGSGVAVAPYLGMKVAHRCLGHEDAGQTAYSATHLTTNPLHWGGKPHFMKLTDWWYRNVVDVREDRSARN